MLLRRFVSVAFKDLRRGFSLGLILLLIVPSFFVMNFVSESLVMTDARQYVYDNIYPWDILIVNWYPYGNSTSGNMSVLAEEIRHVRGVKYVIYPESITYDGWAKVNGKSYFLNIQGVNITDPKFPKPRYLVSGEFFESNYEFSVIVDTVGAKLFEELGIFKGVGNNKTIIDLGIPEENVSIKFSLKGIIDNPIHPGHEEEQLNLTSGIDIYIPVGAFNEIFTIYKKNEGFKYGITYFPAIKVVVNNPDEVDEVAQRIKDKYPGVVLNVRSHVIENLKARIAFETLVVILLVAPIIIFLMAWDVKKRKWEISTLKVFGWGRKHVVLYNLIRVSVIGVLAGFFGLAIPVVLGWFFFGFMMGTLYLFLIFLPYQLAIVTGISIIFSIPAVILAYNVSPEEAVRA